MKKLLLITRKIVLIIPLLLISSFYCYGQLHVYQIGTINTMCMGAGQTAPLEPMSTIKLVETNPGDIPLGHSDLTLIVQSLGGVYYFANGIGSVTLSSGGNISLFQPTSINDIYLFMYINCTGTNVIDTITITGLKMRASEDGNGANGTLSINYTNGSGTAANLTSTINPAPTISFTPAPYYCNGDNTNYALSATPSTGTWTGAGITGTNFNPFGVTAGSKTLTYTVQNGGSCSRSSTVTTFIEATPSISISSNNLTNTICHGSSITFTGTNGNAGFKRYQFLVNGVPVTTLSTTNTYTTSTLSNNDQVAVLTDNGNLTCQNTSSGITVTVVANPNPTVSVSGLPSLVCSSDAGSYPIVTSPAGGTLMGNGISGSTFSPSLAGAGNQVLTYTVTSTVSTTTCNFPATTSVNVIAAPQLSVTSSSATNIICKGDLVTLSVNTFGTTNTIYYRTNTTSSFGPVSAMTHLYSNILNGDVLDVKVTNSDGSCAVISSPFAMTVGEIPKAYFKWKNTCGTNDIQYTDSSFVTQTGSFITGWSWDVDNNGSYDYSTQNPLNSFTAPNSYFTKLQVTTNRGCIHDTTIKVFTLTGITVTPASPYFTNFTSSNATWAFGGKNASWKWGTVVNDSINLGSRNVWSTSASASSKYYVNEKSYLNSPCFNFTQLDKPMISLKIWLETSTNAGSILEASIDGGTTWKQIGRAGIGTNWYDGGGNAGVDDFPEAASVSDAWSGNYNGWKVAKLALNEYAGKPSVRFRIAFGSSIVTTITGGMAFDSIWVGNRSKFTLLEHFTNLNDALCITPDAKVSALVKKRSKDIIPLFFHTSGSLPDSYNVFDKADASSRYLLRTLSFIPYTVYEQPSRVADYKGNGFNNDIDTNEVDSRALETPLFKLDLTTNMTVSGKIDINTRVTYTGNTTYSGDIVLHEVIIEDTTDGNTSYNWTVRKMLPIDASGIYISKKWNNGDTYTSSDSWAHTLIGSRKFAVVSFVETGASNPSTLQAVYQNGTGTNGIFVPTSIKDEVITDDNIIIFPNPSSEDLNIVFHKNVNEKYTWELINNIGVLVDKGNIETGTSNTIIKTQAYSNGVYLLKFIDSESHLVIKKIIIQH